MGERRHDKVDFEGEIVTHFANAFSVRDLHNALEGTAIFLTEWLWYQCLPRKYTARLKISFMIQSRQFMLKHIDMHYASALFRYQKVFDIKYREYCNLVCRDDEPKVKLGEPGILVEMVERAHIGNLVLVAMDKKFEVADHDFTKFSLTTSVSVQVGIPVSIEETFCGGQVYVGIKENCFEPSGLFVMQQIIIPF